eukprot:CAMPEP_0119491960 /NCGR_PEP_ID=MMETSP1344-20130328/16661_1 /TAXON_ID=236787 /ORGANISM="Florenciella parvula, Strain CCMP2471" /LENGTH=139 /DNA_ID=CAMNT_0007527255 /DNA_START=174 /DNA_END=590 /DNA_ORIENTATION=-
MASADYHNLADCCPAGAEPLREMADYEPKGTMVDMQDVTCYVAWPEGPCTSAVVVFHDIFGIHSGRHKQFCDMLAEKGYGAVLPDFFGKDPLVSDPPQYGASCCCFLSMLCGFCCGGLSRKQRELSWDTSMGHVVLDCV